MTSHEVVEEVLAWHEAFRRLGFSADDIYIAITGKRPFCVQAVLRAQGREFRVDVTHELDVERQELLDAWRAGVAGWNGDWSDERRNAIWKNFLPRMNAVPLLVALKDRGFTWRTASATVDA